MDGDGAVIMHTGALAIVGQRAPRRFLHVLVNNGAHETVGGMPTASPGIDYQALARSLGYVAAARAATEDELSRAVPELLAAGGPALLEVVTNTASRADLGRPTTTAYDNGRAFMAYLTKGDARD